METGGARRPLRPETVDLMGPVWDFARKVANRNGGVGSDDAKGALGWAKTFKVSTWAFAFVYRICRSSCCACRVFDPAI